MTAKVVELRRRVAFRCVRCSRRTTRVELPAGWEPVGATLAAIGLAFASALHIDTSGTVGAACSKCAPCVAELIAGLET